MNERDISETQKETGITSPFDAVEIQHFTVDDPVQRVYLPGEAGIGFVTGVGELVNDDGAKILVGEVTYMKGDQARTARWPMDSILATDAERRAIEQERLVSFASKLGEATLNVVAQPLSLSEPEQHPEDWALPRSEVFTAMEDETGVNEDGLITGMPKHLQPEDYKPAMAINGRSGANVPVTMPPNPHRALGFPNRQDYLKSLGQKPDNHN